jgi:hypothetical protein
MAMKSGRFDGEVGTPVEFLPSTGRAPRFSADLSAHYGISPGQTSQRKSQCRKNDR